MRECDPSQKDSHPVGVLFYPMEGFDLHFRRRRKLWCCRRLNGGKQQSTGLLHWIGSNPYSSQKDSHPVGVGVLLAEMEGFEPPHAFRRLADFESAPFSRLGTSPGYGIISVGT